jgi:CHASE3 domain sensor protein
MQTLRRRFSVIGGFALLLSVLVLNALVIRRQLAVQTTNRDRLAHSVQVRLQLSRTLSLLQDAETGQRGFLYTGDSQYLAPYNQAVSQLPPNLDRLAQITGDDPRQQARIPALRSLVQKKLSELAQSIALYQSGKQDEARTLVTSNAGLVFMNVFRDELRAMEQEEDSQEALRSENYLHSRRVTIACIYVASGIAALGSILLAFYILREMELREKHALQIREREEWFRVTLTCLGDAVIAADENGRVTFLNPVAENPPGGIWSVPKASESTKSSLSSTN